MLYKKRWTPPFIQRAFPNGNPPLEPPFSSCSPPRARGPPLPPDNTRHHTTATTATNSSTARPIPSSFALGHEFSIHSSFPLCLPFPQITPSQPCLLPDVGGPRRFCYWPRQSSSSVDQNQRLLLLLPTVALQDYVALSSRPPRFPPSFPSPPAPPLLFFPRLDRDQLRRGAGQEPSTCFRSFCSPL